MLSYVNNGWQLCPYLIKYTQHGESLQAYAIDKAWWEEFAERWDFLTIDEIIEVTHTEEQRKRFEQVRDMPEDFGNLYSEYVETGKVSDLGSLSKKHPFNVVLLSEELPKLANGVIVESDSNANGTFIKFADGTLIAKGEINNESLVVFPHLFSEKPFITSELASNVNTLSFSVANVDVNSSYVAIGRWN